MTRLVESYFWLNTKLLKKTLKKARQKDPVEGEYLNFIHDGRSSSLDYSLEYSFNGDTYLVINFAEESQKILLAERELKFGSRSYLVCGCGKKTNGLYLKLGYFACRRCHKLKYESTTINRHSKHGQFLYQQSRLLKIMAIRESMNRIFYRSRYSKRFRRYLELCGRVGLTNEVSSAQKLMEGINNYQQQV